MKKVPEFLYMKSSREAMHGMAEIRPWHLITSVNPKPVTNVSEFTQAVRMSEDGVLIRVSDGIYFKYTVLPFEVKK